MIGKLTVGAIIVVNKVLVSSFLSLSLLAGCATNPNEQRLQDSVATLGVLVYVDQAPVEKRAQKAEETLSVVQYVKTIVNSGVAIDNDLLKDLVFKKFNVYDKPVTEQFIYSEVVDELLASIPLVVDTPTILSIEQVESANATLDKMIKYLSLYSGAK